MDALEQAHFLDDIASTVSVDYPSDNSSSSMRSSYSEADSLDLELVESIDEPSESDLLPLRVELPNVKQINSGSDRVAVASTDDSERKGSSLTFIATASVVMLGFVVGVYIRRKTAA
jgi:hypothetical protein